ncbi:MAG: S26 family signal peptidase [Phycisphaerae bacterium]
MATELITAQRPSRDSVRDTVESIIVAFILAFVFRAFIVEAFIIPTGSMAPSLYGQHGQHRCSNCGYTYAYGLDDSALRQELALTCPNCDWYCDLAGRGRLPLLSDNGDRILVHKWPFDLGLSWLGPQRWSVIVFKNPLDGKQNYIKRLIGLPNEVLEIVDGDIYAAPLEKVPESIRAKLLSNPLLEHDRGLTGADTHQLDRLLAIRRKPAAAQSSLWMIHYNHDFPPVERTDESPVWSAAGSTADTGWEAATPRVTFDGRDDREHELTLLGKPIADTYAYNARTMRGDFRREQRPVGDVLVRLLLTPRGAAGSFSMALSKRDDQFVAQIAANGKLTLTRRGPRLPPATVAVGAIDPLESGRPLAIEFENLDYRVALRIDGREVLHTSDEEYRPDLAGLRGQLRGSDGAGSPSRVALAARGLALSIQHLAVYRDVYYRSVPTEPPPDNPYALQGIPAWGTVNNPILLRDGEYFVCGDNSPASKDSRLWWENGDFVKRRGDAYQRGTVPADQLIGQAFFVYWPGGHRLGERGLPVIPNVGRMRVIR